jgi:hypothetical protein
MAVARSASGVVAVAAADGTGDLARTSQPGERAASHHESVTPRLRSLALFALLIGCTSTPAPPPSITQTVEASASAQATPAASPTGAGRIVTFYGANDQRIVPAGGVTTVCDLYLRGTIFDFRSGVAYRIEAVSPTIGQPYFAQASTDEAGAWRSPLISLTDGDWKLTVMGALTHPDQTYAVRVVCPGGRAPTPTPSVTLGTISAAGTPTTLELFPQGRLSGKVAWVTKVVPGGTGSPGGQPGSALLELWAIPLDRSAPRLAVRYRTTQMNTFGSTASVDTNVLRRQFSPDGRRIVLSVATGADAGGHGLAVIDLEAGRLVTVIGGSGEKELSPAWSPDGKLIAFVRPLTTAFGSEIWVVGADGSGARRLRTATVGTPNRVFGWTPDSTRIGFSPVDFESTTYALLDLNGSVSGQLRGILNSGDAADWRAREPGFAVSTMDSPYTPTRSDIIVGSDPSLASRFVADVVVNPNDNTVTGVRNPRWDPSGRDRLIYLENGIQGSFVLADISSSNVTKKQAGGRVSFAEWLPDGSGIVTLEVHPPTAPPAAWLYDADGKFVVDALFLPNASNAGYSLTDLAPRAY